MQARMADNGTDLKAEARIWLGDALLRPRTDRGDTGQPDLPGARCAQSLGESYVDEFRVAAVEVAAGFPGVVGAGGTADLLLASASYVMLVDWKFGAVPVRAFIQNDDDSMTMNPQLMFYLCASRHEKPKLFKGRRIAAVIIQPRAEQPFSYTEVYPEELTQFEEDIHNAVTKALAPRCDLKARGLVQMVPGQTELSRVA